MRSIFGPLIMEELVEIGRSVSGGFEPLLCHSIRQFSFGVRSLRHGDHKVTSRDYRRCQFFGNVQVDECAFRSVRYRKASRSSDIKTYTSSVGSLKVVG